jgi:hypothetical protein
MKLLVLLICLSFCISCQKKYSKDVLESLELAGDNREELEKVLTHYEKNQADSLKLKAALFLVKNMKYHTADSKLNYADAVFSQMQASTKYDDKYKDDKRASLILKKLDSLSVINDAIDAPNEYNRTKDVENIKADFLISNIELAFKAWYKIPQPYRADFKDFCNYILPYRNGYEPVSINDRQFLFEKYLWVYDSLKIGTPIEKIVSHIKEDVHFKIITNIRDKYPQTLSVLVAV